MDFYKDLADSVVIHYQNKKPLLMGHKETLTLVGVGRSAFVFKIKNTDKVIKVYFPEFQHLAQEEAEVYQAVQDIDYFPSIYTSGLNYIVIDYIEGHTLFDCLTLGIQISEKEIEEVDFALSLARNIGLNPSDIHLRNIIMTPKGGIKIIDIARFRQTKPCPQWRDLRKAFYRFYRKPLFPKKVPAFLLNAIAVFYKKRLYKLDKDHTPSKLKKRKCRPLP
ncbi:protein kinase family protein [Lederbergia sp. NSJ-179]|uniref:protein kinase family protein n=1 Tax=Lederbergia sp. NSJ-179 TaxID=2931402 RepID=UPI001FD09FC9|nr:protein kinase family protein [Lederbergia sp. NSJ-179]MCJ7843254.1 protein kinase family protein [Lederbergia sp. NSJ-179]